MPLDSAGSVHDPAAYVCRPSDAHANRWGPYADPKQRSPRGITPRSDADALLHIWRMLETRWSRKYNDGDRHCIVGWVGNTCEPTTLNDYTNPQVIRLMQRLHDALPKSYRRKWAEQRFTLAKYNDTRDLPTIRAWVYRAYLAELNARIEELNRGHA